MITNDLKLDYFITKGRTESDYATNSETRKSASRIEIILNRASAVIRSAEQTPVASSVTKAELIAKIQDAQEILCAIRLLKSISLKVKKPMILECSNKRAIGMRSN